MHPGSWNCLGALWVAALVAAHPVAGMATGDCGKPGSPCGLQIPKGVVCAKGAGYCQAGYYCGTTPATATGNGKPASCIRVPPNCGKAGNPACPSNAKTPSRGLDDGMAAKPFCTDGSTAFYSTYPWGNTKAAFQQAISQGNYDPYVGVQGWCQKVDPKCGTAAGAPCCPTGYGTASNPPLKPKQANCLPGGSKLFCQYAKGAVQAAGQRSYLAFPIGKCVANSANCGTYGNACCGYSGGAAAGWNCGNPSKGVLGWCDSATTPPTCRRCPSNFGSLSGQDQLKFFGCAFGRR